MVSTTNMSGVADISGTIITVSPSQKAMQLVLTDGGAGGSAAIALNKDAVDGVTTRGTVPASGIPNYLFSNPGITKVLITPNSASITYFLSPMTNFRSE